MQLTPSAPQSHSHNVAKFSFIWPNPVNSMMILQDMITLNPTNFHSYLYHLSTLLLHWCDVHIKTCVHFIFLSLSDSITPSPLSVRPFLPLSLSFVLIYITQYTYSSVSFRHCSAVTVNLNLASSRIETSLHSPFFIPVSDLK